MSDKEASKASAYRFCRIEGTENVDALLAQIQVILNEGNSHNATSFTKEHWFWQYRNLPTRTAFVYLAYNKQDTIVGYYHVPVYTGIIHGQEKSFAMIQDVAISASERGHGLFRQLATYANNDLLNQNIDIAYTFPNQKSIHTFIKYNHYNLVCAYDTYLMPVNVAMLVKAKTKNSIIGFLASAFLKAYSQLTSIKTVSIEKLLITDQLTTAVSTLYDQFSAQFPIHLQKDFNYLNWRYNQKITTNQKVISLKEGGKIVATGIFKLDGIMGADALILMDFAFEKESDMVLLIHSVRKYAPKIFSQDIAMIFTAFVCHRFLPKNRSGFIKIPKRFNPRPLNLLVRQFNYLNDDCFNATNWLTTLTDWDVF